MDNDVNTEAESEHITTLSGLTSSVHINPIMIATISIAYIDSLDDTLLVIDTFKSGIKTLIPASPIFGSFDPSV